MLYRCLVVFFFNAASELMSCQAGEQGEALKWC